MALPSKKRPRTALDASFGLIDLFGARRQRNQRNQSSVKKDKHESRESSRATNYSEQPFFTFRMEHREGGALAQHFGEERILLFRSDQRGAIGKIIYSSNQTGNVAEAKVHVLSIKDSYRGFDLGGLLFSKAMLSLRQRYYHGVNQEEKECESEINDKDNIPRFSVRCQLDAEEDIRRHNKLVVFYQTLGCHINRAKKVAYINNNDGETYRKGESERSG